MDRSTEDTGFVGVWGFGRNVCTVYDSAPSTALIVLVPGSCTGGVGSMGKLVTFEARELSALVLIFVPGWGTLAASLDFRCSKEAIVIAASTGFPGEFLALSFARE